MDILSLINDVLSIGPFPGAQLAFWNLLAMAAPLVGKLFSGGAKASAQNRDASIGAGLQRDQIATQRGQLDLQQQRENREERDNAWQTLQRLAYAKGQAGPASRPSYLPEQYYNANAVRRTSAEELQGGQGLEQELMARLGGGPKSLNLPAMTDVNKLSKPSGFEKFMGYAGAGLGAFPALYGMFTGNGGDPDPWRE